MTISKPKIYRVENDPPPPKTVCIGISLITVETYTVIIDSRAVNLPVDDEVVFLTVPLAVVNLPNGCASYDIIADLLELEGYRRSHWKIMSVWSCVPDNVADEIF